MRMPEQLLAKIKKWPNRKESLILGLLESFWNKK